MNCTGIPIHQIHYKRLPNYLLASQRGCNLQPPKSITIPAASIPCCLAWDILLRAYCETLSSGDLCIVQVVSRPVVIYIQRVCAGGGYEGAW